MPKFMPKTESEKRAANAMRQAAYRKRHLMTERRNLLIIPNGLLDLDEIDYCAGKTLALYEKTIHIVQTWIDSVDPTTLTPAEVFLALRLLAPALESLVVLRGKVIEQRGLEAQDVTQPAKPKEALEGVIEMLRHRFRGSEPPQAN